MKNIVKFTDKLSKFNSIADFGVGYNGEVLSCLDLKCDECIFYQSSDVVCSNAKVKWLFQDTTLSQFEKETLLKLKHLGYHYLIRNYFNEVFAFKEKPIILQNKEIAPSVHRIPITVFDEFSCVRKCDTEPTNIDDLIKE